MRLGTDPRPGCLFACSGHQRRADHPLPKRFVDFESSEPHTAPEGGVLTSCFVLGGDAEESDCPVGGREDLPGFGMGGRGGSPGSKPESSREPGPQSLGYRRTVQPEATVGGGPGCQGPQLFVLDSWLSPRRHQVPN